MQFEGMCKLWMRKPLKQGKSETCPFETLNKVTAVLFEKKVKKDIA